MKVGTVKEIKTHEYRVWLDPSERAEIVHHGHDVVLKNGLALALALMTTHTGAQAPRYCPRRRMSSTTPT